MRQELRRSFHDRLTGVRGAVSVMADAVLAGVSDVTAALISSDVARAERVLTAQATTDCSSSGIEAEVHDLVALQSPVGRDLRFLLASLRIAQELELCSGLVRSVACRVGRVDGSVLTPPIASLVGDMGLSATSMLRRAVAGYAVLDDAASSVMPHEVDLMAELHRRLLGALFRIDGIAVEPAVELGLVARFYERLGDHAVVIAERVSFAASGSETASQSDP